MATAKAAAAAGGGGVEPVIGEFSIGCCICHRCGQRPLNIAAARSSAEAAAGRAARDQLMEHAESALTGCAGAARCVMDYHTPVLTHNRAGR
jgi:hypothetical protein